MTEMPSREDLRNKTILDLYSCEEFSVKGVLYPGNKLHVHLDWPAKKLTPSIYKKMLGTMVMIREGCRTNGIPAVYCLVPESLVKFEAMLGFNAIEKWSGINEPVYLMKQEA